MPKKMPIVTLEAIDKALASEQFGDNEQYDKEDFGKFTKWVGTFFGNYGHPIFLRSNYNVCYNALRESADLPQLSYESLVHTFFKVAEETTGKRWQDIGPGTLWHKYFVPVFEKERARLEKENPLYLKMVVHMGVMAMNTGITSPSMPLTAGIVVYRAMEKELSDLVD